MPHPALSVGIVFATSSRTIGTISLSHSGLATSAALTLSSTARTLSEASRLAVFKVTYQLIGVHIQKNMSPVVAPAARCQGISSVSPSSLAMLQPGSLQSSPRRPTATKVLKKDILKLNARHVNGTHAHHSRFAFFVGIMTVPRPSFSSSPPGFRTRCSEKTPTKLKNMPVIPESKSKQISIGGTDVCPPPSSQNL